MELIKEFNHNNLSTAPKLRSDRDLTQLRAIIRKAKEVNQPHQSKSLKKLRKEAIRIKQFISILNWR